MNYDEIARKALDRARQRCTDSSTDLEIQAIAEEEVVAALRRTANEAAWRGFEYGRDHQHTTGFEGKVSILRNVTAKYGPASKAETELGRSLVDGLSDLHGVLKRGENPSCYFKTTTRTCPKENTTNDLTFARLNCSNVARANRWHKGGLEEWSVNDWLTAFGGEAGEALNAGKKHRRLLSGIQQHGNVPENIAEAEHAIMLELADAVIYADLVAARLGYQLEDAIIRKFNSISDREGFPEKL